MGASIRAVHSSALWSARGSWRAVAALGAWVVAGAVCVAEAPPAAVSPEVEALIRAVLRAQGVDPNVAPGTDDGNGGTGGNFGPGANTPDADEDDIGRPPAAAQIGWTPLAPSAASRVVYVSSVVGDDANDGLSQQRPKRTIAAGMALLRDRMPDWLLLRKGDTFVGGLGTSWNKSGASGVEPMVVGSYGGGGQRPRLLTGLACGFRKLSSAVVEHVVIVGISMTSELYTGVENTAGVSWIGPGGDLLIEDCEIIGFGTGVQIDGWQGMVQNVRIRRSIVADSYSLLGHSQGIFMNMVDGILIEENVLDHNGWREGMLGAEQTIFNHNLYLTKDTTANTTVRGNIVANASSHGMQMRRGGVCENNLVIGNPIGILFGQTQSAWPSQSATGVVRSNVVIESRDIANMARGYGIWLQMADGVTVEKNLVAHQTRGRAPVAVRVDTNFRDIRFEGNVIYNWSMPGEGGGVGFQLVGALAEGQVSLIRNTVEETNSAMVVHHKETPAPGVFRFQANRYYTNAAPTKWFKIASTAHTFPGWLAATGDAGSVAQTTIFPDATRSVGTYGASIGGPSTLEGFVTEARKQSRSFWRQSYTANSANTWIRAGYGLR